MAFITQTVDKSKVNYQTYFTYKINASFCGITSTICSAKIIDFIPNYLEYILPKVQSPILRIYTEEVAGIGTKIIFDLGAIKNPDLALTVVLSCKFKPDIAKPSTSFTNQANILINDTLEISATAPAVTLKKIPCISKTSCPLYPQSDKNDLDTKIPKDACSINQNIQIVSFCEESLSSLQSVHFGKTTVLHGTAISYATNTDYIALEDIGTYYLTCCAHIELCSSSCNPVLLQFYENEHPLYGGSITISNSGTISSTMLIKHTSPIATLISLMNIGKQSCMISNISITILKIM
ncbi:MAG: hypothetical protein ACRC7V_06335 [Lachnospiraceae bacterium]